MLKGWELSCCVCDARISFVTDGGSVTRAAVEKLSDGFVTSFDDDLLRFSPIKWRVPSAIDPDFRERTQSLVCATSSDGPRFADGTFLEISIRKAFAPTIRNAVIITKHAINNSMRSGKTTTTTLLLRKQPFTFNFSVHVSGWEGKTCRPRSSLRRAVWHVCAPRFYLYEISAFH